MRNEFGDGGRKGFVLLFQQTNSQQGCVEEGDKNRSMGIEMGDRLTLVAE